MRLSALLVSALAALAPLAGCSSPESATLPNFAAPLPGIYTSGQPSASQFAALPSIGITRVICLRRPGEKGTGWEEARAAELGIDYVRLPINSKTDLTRASVERLCRELEKPCEAGTLVCCGSSDRVGAMFALKACWIDGESAENALAIGRDAGLNRLEPLVSRQLVR